MIKFFVFALSIVIAAPASASDLIERLGEGGYVVYLRHADTTGEPRDATMDMENRALQRNLSEAGRAQARAIGAAAQRLGVDPDEVRTSPVFRARDTAELAFGVDRVIVDQRLTADDYVRGDYRPYVAGLRAMLAQPPEVGNTWLVGHIVPLRMAVGAAITRRSFGEGGAAVFRPEGDRFTLIGILPRGWEE